MLNTKKYAITIGGAFALTLTHFGVYLASESQPTEEKAEPTMLVYPDLFRAKNVDERQFAQLMGVEYIEPQQAQENTPNTSDEQSIILLNDLTVIIRSIALINGHAVVRIEYGKEGETKSVKLEQGDELLGFVFVGGNSTYLNFERDGVRNQYRIFKRNEIKEQAK